MSVIGKLNFLCDNDQILKDDVVSSYELNKNPWCADGEFHCPKWCGGMCCKIKLLLAIIEKTIKKTFQRKKKNAFLLFIV